MQPSPSKQLKWSHGLFKGVSAIEFAQNFCFRIDFVAVKISASDFQKYIC